MENAVLLLLLVTLASTVSSNVVHTQLGSLHGWTGQSREGRNYSAFTKIPYAKPPVGNLRFKNPVHFGKWEGVLNATDVIPECVQYDAFNFKGEGYKLFGSEDCLYLNIYVPQGVSKKLPVLMYIHGGGFQFGHPGGLHMARFIMDEDVILVAITYRLNVFGFLSLEDSSIPGNFGLKDQAMALRWVKDNIHSFGGDADRIVIFGESAGGASTHILLLSPLTKDLMSGAVSSSGTVMSVWSLAQPGEVRKATLRLGKTVGCSVEARELLDCLQNVSFETWTEPLMKSGMQFRPCIEPDAPGAVIPTHPFNMTPKAPWIASFTNGEYLITYLLDRGNKTRQNLTSSLRNSLLYAGLKSTEITNEIIERIEIKYANKADKNDDLKIKSAIDADFMFTFPVLDALHRQPGVKYFYVFEHRGRISSIDASKSRRLKVQKASHADELIYLFDISHRANNSAMNEVDLKVSKDYIKLLTNFASFSNPTPKNSINSSLVEWKPWTKNEVLRITSSGNFMGDSEYYEIFEDAYKFWKEILPSKFQHLS